ncbi:MAG: DNA-3-methyladenine glycosylase [Methanolinea sp.]|jgi:DNA-3-methyladenine glycosylase II|nr:DNA-3-methyladenine glycosylase [Methanolinea sp.]
MSFLIRPVAPYDFSLSCRVFSGGDPAFRTFQNGIFSQVIRVGGDPFVIRIRDVGEDGDTVLAVDALAGEEESEYCAGDVRRCISHLLGLDDDLNRYYRATEEDPVLTRINSDLSGLKMPSSETVFEALVISIIEQQIATPVARKIESRLVKRFGEEVRAAKRTYYAYPRPEDLADADPAEIRECGLSARKGDNIKSVARMVRDGALDLESLGRTGDSDSLIRDLCRIRGIGRWTAEFVLLRGLHRLDMFPADDLGIRRAIGHFYCPGEEISPARAREISRQWGEWKGLAAYYLLVADQQVRKRTSHPR